MRCTIAVDWPTDDMERLFRTELSRAHPRSSVTLEGGTFTIDAEDVTSLRAAVNGITSTLKVYEKTHGI